MPRNAASAWSRSSGPSWGGSSGVRSFQVRRSLMRVVDDRFAAFACELKAAADVGVSVEFGVTSLPYPGGVSRVRLRNSTDDRLLGREDARAGLAFSCLAVYWAGWQLDHVELGWRGQFMPTPA